MKVVVVESGDTQCLLEIQLEGERVSLEYERVFNRQASEASLPGFRKGKAPRSLLEQRLGEAVRQEFLNDLLPKATLEAVREQKLRMVGFPRIESLDFKAKAEPLSFKARVELKPVVELKGSLEGMKLSAPSAAVSPEEIEEQIKALRERQGVPGAEVERPAAMGDQLSVDFEGRINGELFPGGKAEAYTVVLGRKQLIPGFEEGLVGAKKGETRQLKVPFPADYPAADVAGKDAEFLVTVLEIREIKLPELDDTFAKALGGVENLAELRDAVGKAIAAQKERMRRGRLQDGAAAQLLEKYPVKVPAAMLSGELNILMEREVGRLREQGMEPSGEEGMKEIAQRLTPMAEQRARLSLILETIADKMDIAVTDQEFQDDMALAAPQLGMSLEQTLSWVRSQPNREMGIRARLREEKALKYLVEKATLTEI